MEKHGEGILTGCNANHEWMLKWWWSNYKQSNAYPVTFVDFGMSVGAKSWCEQRGAVLSIPKRIPLIPPKNASSYASIKRPIWLSKPEALLRSPYQKTIWVDIDAMVKQSLAGLFALCPQDTLALCPELSFRSEAEKESELIPKEAISFNTGVVVYPECAPLIPLWAQAAKETDALGDQDLLSRLIYETKTKVLQLPPVFNQIHPALDHADVVIYHYASQMGQSTLLEKLKVGTSN